MNPFTRAELKRLSSGNKLQLSWKVDKNNVLCKRLSTKIGKAITAGVIVDYAGYDPFREEFVFYMCKNIFVVTEDELDFLVVRWSKEEEHTAFSDLCKKIKDKYRKSNG